MKTYQFVIQTSVCGQSKFLIVNLTNYFTKEPILNNFKLSKTDTTNIKYDRLECPLSGAKFSNGIQVNYN